jgi:alkyl hydroperoxide reductase subunit AhpF
MSGEEAAIEIRKTNKNIPIVIFTADLNSDIITQDKNNNVINMSIDKSISKQELLDSIESIFDKI